MNPGHPGCFAFGKPVPHRDWTGKPCHPTYWYNHTGCPGCPGCPVAEVKACLRVSLVSLFKEPGAPGAAMASRGAACLF